MGSLSQYVVLAEFEVEPSRREEFVQGVLANRRDTLATEQGCRKYEVCIPHDREDRVFVVEFYDDKDAFDAHHATAHWKRWHDTVAHLIINNRSTHLSRRL